MWMGRHNCGWHARGQERPPACRKMLLHCTVADLRRFGARCLIATSLPCKSTSSHYDPRTTMQNESVPQVQLVLVVIGPPSGVRFAVQSGRDGLLQPYSSSVNVYCWPSL